MINLFSVPISITSKPQALAVVGEWVREFRAKGQRPRAKVIVTPNPEIIVAAQSDPEFLKALQAADLAIPDGIGIVWAIKKLKVKSEKLKVERISGLDLMEFLILQPQKVAPYELHPLKVMLVGGRPGVAQAAAKILSENSENSDSRQVRKSDNRKAGSSDSPVLRPSDSSGSPVRDVSPNGTLRPSIPSVLKIKAISGPEDITHAPKTQLNNLINSINSFRPDLLFVGFGHGKQEKWLMDNRERLTAGVAMAVGGAFDQIADPSLRPPLCIDSIGLGWLYRLLRQPWRVKRQLALIKFVWMVLKDRILEGRK